MTFFSYSRKPNPSRNALKLGGKSKDVDSFVDQLKNEGEKISNLMPANSTTNSISKNKPPASDVPTDE